ncbi:MAG: thiamine-phosphate kinase [Phycisphaerae bacterium]|nr:thiamine-phosphate kinase [Phycisphaerae bacterium]
MKESDFLTWIYSQNGFDPEKVPVGPGDDMGIVNLDADTPLLVGVDQVLDGVHFNLALHGAEAAGRKAMARNLSDVAAMAALPVGAVASVALPKGFSQNDAQQIYAGLRKLGDEFACPLVGGDVSTWAGPLGISVTIFAKPAGATGGIKPVLRSGARSGNAILVTGQLGGSWYGKHHLEFVPRVREAILLGLKYRLRAMIDISDGLTKDLGRICKASNVGAEIWEDAIPIRPGAGKDRDPKASPLDAALNDGEDYELLFTVPKGQVEKIMQDVADGKIPVAISHIGTITKQQTLTLVSPDGSQCPLTDGGWDHET